MRMLMMRVLVGVDGFEKSVVVVFGGWVGFVSVVLVGVSVVLLLMMDEWGGVL